MADANVIVQQPTDVKVIVRQPSFVKVLIRQPTINVATPIGLPGMRGLQGVQGVQGLKGDIGDNNVFMGSYVFTVPALEWLVEHNQGTQAFIAYIKDDQGTIMLAATEVLSDLAFIVHLTCAMSGRVDVLFGIG